MCIRDSDNAAVEGAHKLDEGCEGIYRLEQRSARRRKQRASRKRSRLERQAEKQTQEMCIRDSLDNKQIEKLNKLRIMAEMPPIIL